MTDSSPLTSRSELTPDRVVEDMTARFIAAPVDGPNGERVAQISEAVRDLAVLIEHHVPGGRNKSLALTALEETHMRANRGIHAEGKPGA